MVDINPPWRPRWPRSPPRQQQLQSEGEAKVSFLQRRLLEAQETPGWSSSGTCWEKTGEMMDNLREKQWGNDGRTGFSKLTMNPLCSKKTAENLEKRKETAKFWENARKPKINSATHHQSFVENSG